MPGIYSLVRRKFQSSNYGLLNFQIYIKQFLPFIIKEKPLHTVTQKFGFRTVEVKQRDGIYVNGVKVKMKGVNRHSFRPKQRQNY